MGPSDTVRDAMTIEDGAPVDRPDARPWLVFAAWAAAVVLVLGVSLALRGLWLEQRQMFKDEGASWLLSSYPLGDLISHTMNDVYPPLYALALKAWMGLLGDSLSALRSLSVVFGMGVVVVAWRWGHEALGRSWGLIVLIAVGFSGLALEDAREVRMHVLEVFTATLAWWLAWRLAQDPPAQRRWRWLAIGGLVVGVAGELWTSPMGLPTVLLQGLFVAVAVGWFRRPGARLALGAIIGGCLAYLPWLPIQATVALNGQAFWSPVPEPLLVPYAFATQLVGRGHTRVPEILAGLALLALVGAGVVDLLLGQRAPSAEDARRDRLLGWAVVFGLLLIPLAWLYSQLHSVWDVGYFGNVIAPLAIALAAGGRALARRLPRTRSVALVIGVIVALVLGYSAAERLQERLADTDLTPARQVYDRLASLARPGDVVLAIDSRSDFALQYLLERRTDPLPLAASLYTWDNGHEPFFYGQGLIDGSRLLTEARVRSGGGWTSVFPGLGQGGRVLLVDLEDDDLANLGFGPLDDGELDQRERIDISYAGRIAQIRTLVVAP
jgi:hypothetical protein